MLDAKTVLCGSSSSVDAPHGATLVGSALAAHLRAPPDLSQGGSVQATTPLCWRAHPVSRAPHQLPGSCQLIIIKWWGIPADIPPCAPVALTSARSRSTLDHSGSSRPCHHGRCSTWISPLASQLSESSRLKEMSHLSRPTRAIYRCPRHRRSRRRRQGSRNHASL